jgi:NAD(P)-dependent dehydrogenase (short-subunit alcohol dehydrogenase family)
MILPMRILIIGANGVIGKLITPELAEQHEVITAGRNSGDLRVDIACTASLETMFQQVKALDACICVAGDSETCEFSQLTETHLQTGINSKLLGQINLVRIGQKYLHDNASFTLTSGKMGDKPVKGATGKAFVNGAINSFVLAASLDLPRGLLLNAVSPAKIGSVANEKIIMAYRRAVESRANGEIFRIY